MTRTVENPVAAGLTRDYPTYADAKRSEVASSIYWLDVQLAWVDECGGDRAGYRAHYGHSNADGIFDADVDTLQHSLDRLLRSAGRSTNCRWLNAYGDVKDRAERRLAALRAQ